MGRSKFETALKKKLAQITFSGHRVNDDYSLSKRKAIAAAVMSAFDEANRCHFDPTQPPYDTASIGMFHCPECGEMVLAGAPHPDYSLINS
jgi:hypothetical protein